MEWRWSIVKIALVVTVRPSLFAHHLQVWDFLCPWEWVAWVWACLWVWVCSNRWEETHVVLSCLHHHAEGCSNHRVNLDLLLKGVILPAPLHQWWDANLWITLANYILKICCTTVGFSQRFDNSFENFNNLICKFECILFSEIKEKPRNMQSPSIDYTIYEIITFLTNKCLMYITSQM